MTTLNTQDKVNPVPMKQVNLTELSTKEIILQLKQRDVTYRRMHTLTYEDLNNMTYEELQNKYYDVIAPKTKKIRLIEPIKEVIV